MTQNGGGPNVAADQTLVYLDGFRQRQQQLSWFGRAGENLGKIGSPQFDIRDPALSPDEKLVAVTALEGGNWDLWSWEISRDVKNRLTFSETSERNPVWSPTAAELVFTSNRGGSYDISLRKADGSDEPRLLAAGSYNRVGHRLVPGTADILFTQSTVRKPGLTSGIWNARAKVATGESQPLFTNPVSRVPSEVFP